MKKNIQFIHHRKNSSKELSGIEDLACGVEVDIRSDLTSSGSLHVSHDPWIKGENFSEWLRTYADKKFTGPLILNVKEEGLECKLFELMDKFKITNFFILDASLPSMVNWTKTRKEFAVRLSTYEPPELLLRFKERVSWIWLDCFHAEPIRLPVELNHLESMKICLVSPELQGGLISDIGKFLELSEKVDAICTKFPEEWRKQLNQ